MPAPIPVPPPIPKPRRKLPVILLSVILAITGLVGGCVWWSRDEPPPDVSDFHFEPLQLPEDQNAYALITKAILHLSERSWTPDEEEAREAMAHGNSWDDAIAEIALADLTAVRPLLDKAVQVPRSQTPWLSALSDIATEIGKMPNLHRTLSISALAKSREGNPDEALQIVKTSLLIGHKVEGSHGTLIHYLTGMSLKRGALVLAEKIVAENSATEEALREMLHAVASTRPGTQSLTKALHSELRLFDDGLKQVTSGIIAEMADDPQNDLLRTAPHIPLFFKPNKTRRIYADFLRHSVSDVDHPLDKQSARMQQEEFEGYIKQSIVTHPENAIGRLYLAIFVPGTARVLSARLRHQSNISAVETLLALHLYQRAHAQLPETLDALVPAYLPAVPRDYFDGQPIRYSRELGVIWSVGENQLAITAPDQKIAERELVIRLTPPAAQ